MEQEEVKWKIGDKHPELGVVGAMGVREGEPYRMFVDGSGSVALIPLDVLERLDEQPEQENETD